MRHECKWSYVMTFTIQLKWCLRDYESVLIQNETALSQRMISGEIPFRSCASDSMSWPLLSNKSGAYKTMKVSDRSGHDIPAKRNKWEMWLKGVGLGNPNCPTVHFFFNLHHWIVTGMSKCIICQSFKKFHRAIFSIAHPKYSNFGGIIDARWYY